MSRYLAAYFSPLRDPYLKDWLFYVYLFFTVPSVLGVVASSAGVQVFFSIALTLVINWIIF